MNMANRHSENLLHNWRLFSKSKPKRSATIVVSFIAVGVILYIGTHAASPTTDIQAENGVLGGNAQRITGNSAASNNAYIKFAAPIAQPTSRGDITYWPYSRWSLWNMPINDNAQYHNPVTKWRDGVSRAGLDSNLTAIFEDRQWIFRQSEGTHVVPMKYAEFYNNNDATGRCAAQYITHQSYGVSSVNAPAWFPGYSPASQGTHWNDHGAVITADKTREYDNGVTSWCSDHIQADLPADPSSASNLLTSEGRAGGHGASALNSLGPTIHPGELTNGIKHVMSIQLAGWKQYYRPANCRGGTQVSGAYQWPAYGNDGYACEPPNGSTRGYGGTDSTLKVGSLLAIPRNITPESIGITTMEGRNLFYGFVNYGAYTTDDSYDGDNNGYVNINVEAKATLDYENTHYGLSPWDNAGPLFQDVKKIIAKLQVVADNGPTNIGGAGNPLVCYAPPVGNDANISNPNGSRTQPSTCP